MRDDEFMFHSCLYLRAVLCSLMKYDTMMLGSTSSFFFFPLGPNAAIWSTTAADGYITQDSLFSKLCEMHSVQGIRFWENIGQNSYGIYAVYIELMQFHLPQKGANNAPFLQMYLASGLITAGFLTLLFNSRVLNATWGCLRVTMATAKLKKTNPVAVWPSLLCCSRSSGVGVM